MRFLTVLPFAAHTGGPDFAPIAQAVSAEAITAVLGFASPETCLALTDDPALAALAGERGIETLPVSAGLGGNLLGLPPEARARLSDFAKTGKTDETAVLLVNPFNPQLTAQRLKAATKAFLKAPQGPLVSVRACRNHPCQFQRYLRLVDIDTLHLLDPAWLPSPEIKANGADCLLASLPFSPNAVERTFFPTQPGQLASCLDGRPLSHPEDGLAIMHQSDGLARLVFAPQQQIQCPPDHHGPRHDGFRLAGMLGHLRHTAALFEDAGAGERHIFLTRNFPLQPEFLLRLIPFTTQDTLWAQAVDVPVARLDRSCRLPENPPPGTVGYVVCVLDTGQHGGEAELMEVFTPPLARWDFRNSRPYNLEKGCEITGRQVFPEVVRPDGSLVVLPLAMAMEGDWALENARAYLLPDEESLIVTDEMDYLRLLARRQANATCPQKT